ncbi:hypothetical protein [Streptomyces griseorubiginosus]
MSAKTATELRRDAVGPREVLFQSGADERMADTARVYLLDEPEPIGAVQR